jgi:hypothetical protein
MRSSSSWERWVAPPCGKYSKKHAKMQRSVKRHTQVAGSGGCRISLSGSDIVHGVRMDENDTPQGNYRPNRRPLVVTMDGNNRMKVFQINHVNHANHVYSQRRVQIIAASMGR